jgi:hypothetical protein
MPIDITRHVEVKVSLSAFDMGQGFANMHSEEQAHFFSGVAKATKSLGKPDCFQWQALRDDLDKLPEALRCFKSLAEYAEDFEA